MFEFFIAVVKSTSMVDFYGDVYAVWENILYIRGFESLPH